MNTEREKVPLPMIPSLSSLPDKFEGSDLFRNLETDDRNDFVPNTDQQILNENSSHVLPKSTMPWDSFHKSSRTGALLLRMAIKALKYDFEQKTGIKPPVRPPSKLEFGPDELNIYARNLIEKLNISG